MMRNFYVTQEGKGILDWFDSYKKARESAISAIRKNPEKQLGMFLIGSDASLLWWFGGDYKPWPSEKLQVALHKEIKAHR